MGHITIIKKSVADMGTDAVVNAANEHLAPGGGVCGAIFRQAGYNDMCEACERIGHCDTGSAVITPGFALRAKYVIHAVGPIWQGGSYGEPELLASCYQSSLDLAAENGCHSVAFPVISSGIFGYPKREAWRIALSTCADWLDAQDDVDLQVYFCVLGDDPFELGHSVMGELGLE